MKELFAEPARNCHDRLDARWITICVKKRFNSQNADRQPMVPDVPASGKAGSERLYHVFSVYPCLGAAYVGHPEPDLENPYATQTLSPNNNRIIRNGYDGRNYIVCLATPV